MENYNIELVNNPRILVVEDNLIAQEVARYLLTKNGYSVDIINNGIEALRLSETHDYVFTILDFALPDMNGVDIAHAIRVYEKAHNRSQQPVIILSASVDEAEIEQCLTAGVNEVFPKPLTVEIIEKIKKL